MATSYDLSYRILDLSTQTPVFAESISNPDVERVLIRVAQKLAEQNMLAPAAEFAIECLSFQSGSSQIIQSQTLSTVLTLAADHYRPHALKEAKESMASNMLLILKDKRRLERLRETVEELALPTLKVGDMLMIGKFKNRRAIITGFDTDEQNQPVAKTDKGDVKILKVRVAALMPEPPDKPETAATAK